MTYLLAFSFALGIMVTCFIALIMPRISPYSVALTCGEKAALENLARKYTSPYYQDVRAKAILIAAQGLRNDDIAARVSLPRQIGSKWLKLFLEQRLAGLGNLQQSGHPPS